MKLSFSFFRINKIIVGGLMLLSDLQGKDVIDVITGGKIGTIIDVLITKDGKIEELSVQKRRFLFFNSNVTSVKWMQIDKIGKDVILVNVSS